MQLEPALLSYAGLACLALTTTRLRRDIALRPLPPVGALQALAVAILAIAAWQAVHLFGPYQGPVAFIGMLAGAGLLLVLLLSRWPQAAILAAIGASVLAVLALTIAAAP
ncbi:MAG: DUF3325 family protein [Sphingomonadales bacterium]|nr:DUF3325 family protein [Sphingomonadales bacterium]